MRTLTRLFILLSLSGCGGGAESPAADAAPSQELTASSVDTIPGTWGCFEGLSGEKMCSLDVRLPSGCQADAIFQGEKDATIVLTCR